MMKVMLRTIIITICSSLIFANTSIKLSASENALDSNVVSEF